MIPRGLAPVADLAWFMIAATAAQTGHERLVPARPTGELLMKTSTPTPVLFEGAKFEPTMTSLRSATEIAETSGTHRSIWPARSEPPTCHDGFVKKPLTPPPEALLPPEIWFHTSSPE